MPDRPELEPLFEKRGLTSFTWVDPREFVIAHWVRMKCRHGCDGYGRHPMCPPNAPPVEECRAFFSEYTTGVVFHMPQKLDKPEDRRDWLRDMDGRLLKLERDVFLEGFPKALALFAGGCHICAECGTTPEGCNHPESARPTPEGLAMDVFSTVRHYGLPIQVLKDLDAEMNRYSFLLVE